MVTASTDREVINVIKDKFGKNVAETFGKRGRDLLVNIHGKYIVGEARFLSTPGGSQGRDLREALNFVKRVNNEIALPNLIAVAILDGIMWFYNPYVRELRSLNSNEHALSSLLLKDFLDSFW